MPNWLRRLWRRRSRRPGGPMNPGIGMSPGVVHYDWGDPYHVALALPWRWFLALTLAYYLLVNLFFAALYTLQPGSVSNVRPGHLSDAFFFSVQTFATVGYGAMSPQDTYGNIVSAIEIFVGLMSIAVIAGVVFVRFSRPRSRLAFARNLVIGPADGGTALSARIVNRRLNPLYNVEARMVLITRHRPQQGPSVWRIRDLKLLRERSLVEMMSWTLVHMIDEFEPAHRPRCRRPRPGAGTGDGQRHRHRRHHTCPDARLPPVPRRRHPVRPRVRSGDLRGCRRPPALRPRPRRPGGAAEAYRSTRSSR